MKKPNFSTRSISMASFLLGLLTLTTSNLYFASSEPDSILGCANKKTGVLRIAAKCANTERAIQWSKTGPVGPEGPVGPAGIAGPKGETGAAGPAGEVGPQGLPGLNGLNGFSGSNGPAGPAGAPGRQLLVRDSTNALVGYFAGTLTTSMVAETTPSGNFYQNAVQVWDPNLELLFIYSFSGRPITSYVLFSQSSCTGQAYLANSSSQVGDRAEASRFVAHSSSANGPIQWFERATDVYVAGVISIASAPHYSNNCDPGSEFGDVNFSGNIPHIVLNPISSPVPTFTGPLRITLS